ncbi:MAG: hypothetical protein K2Z81_26865 [Cyanobacteria bacterium]|nr:hypothetical protein [Cyanobacteriota bacterium]
MHRIGRSLVATTLSATFMFATMPLPAGAQNDNLNFKIYNPDGDSAKTPAPAKTAGAAPNYFSVPMAPSLQAEKPKLDDAPAKPAAQQKAAAPAAPKKGSAAVSTAANTGKGNAQAPAVKQGQAQPAQTASAAGATGSKLLKGYVRVVPTGTKVPIIMDTAIDSDTSQEGDEFSARTSEDLMIDGNTVVPAGSIIKGRIAQINAPKHLNRSGSIALKFDTLTTPDNRQIPLVATLVARKGVVHARRGMKDIAMDTGALTLPIAAGLGIGALAGGSNSSSSGSSSSIGRGGAAMIGAAVGAAVGIAILCSKKGKKVDVRPGDELKIELGEDLRMPLM